MRKFSFLVMLAMLNLFAGVVLCIIARGYAFHDGMTQPMFISCMALLMVSPFAGFLAFPVTLESESRHG